MADGQLERLRDIDQRKPPRDGRSMSAAEPRSGRAMYSVHSQAISFLTKQSGLGSILHLGAGRGNELAEYLTSQAKRIVLVEPQPELAQQLSAMAAEDTRIIVKEAAVAATAGSAMLQVLNFAELSSLRAPRGIRELFPSLRVVSTVDVLTATLGSLIDVLPPPNPTQPDLLVVSAPGEGATIVDALLSHPDRHRFGAVLLREGAAAETFEGSEPIAGLVERLCADGYQPYLIDVSDPDQPTMLVVLGHLEVEHNMRFASLKTQHDTLRAETAVLALQVEGQQVEIEEQHAQLLCLQESGQAEKAALLAFRIEEIDALTSIRDRLAAERDAAEASRQEVAEKLAEVSTARDVLLHERDSARSERDAALDDVEAATVRLVVVEAERDELNKAVATCAAERDVANKEVISLKDRIYDVEFRLGLAHEEFHRSEGQIALIKDLLLREGNL